MRNKRLIFACLGAIVAILAGCALVFVNPSYRQAVMEKFEHITRGSNPQPVAAKTPKPTPVRAAHVETADDRHKVLAQKESELKELYGSLNAWTQRLQEKRNLLTPGTADQIRAFNEDYAGYQAALTDYKNQVAQLKKLQTAK